MRCILPYHEHNYFTRAVQMLRLNDKLSSWTWLEPAQVKISCLPNRLLLIGYLLF